MREPSVSDDTILRELIRRATRHTPGWPQFGGLASPRQYLPLYRMTRLDPPYERLVIGPADDPVTLPFADAWFDAVASVGVLEHVRESGGSEAGSLAEIVRVLRPGGVFLCCHFPNRTSWIDFLARRVPRKHHHVYRYGRGDVTRLVKDAGFELLELRRYGLLPRMLLTRVLGPLRDSRVAADTWDAVDVTLGALLSTLCQNWGFAARKPAR